MQRDGVNRHQVGGGGGGGGFDLRDDPALG